MPGFAVMESLVKPMVNAVLVARENMASGVLSVSELGVRRGLSGRQLPESAARLVRAHTLMRLSGRANGTRWPSGTSRTMLYILCPANLFVAWAGFHDDKSARAPSVNA